MSVSQNSSLTIGQTKPQPWRRWLIIAVSIGLMTLLLAPSLKRLSYNVWLGAIAAGLCFSFVAIGVLISFRILDVPDLTLDGSLPLGAAITAAMITAGYNPFISLLVAAAAGALAGATTALITTRLHIHSLLASILTTTALFSINLHIMGKSNIPLLNEATIFTPFAAPFQKLILIWGGVTLARSANNLLAILLVGGLVLLVKFIFDWFMRTEIGLAMRATGSNPQMVRSVGVNTDTMIIIGLAVGNALVGLSGAIFAQFQGFADINMGTGLIIAGLAAVILGETFFQPRKIVSASAAVLLGMVVYRLAIAAALNISLPMPGGAILRIDPLDVKLATAILVLAALGLTRLQQKNKPRE